MNVRWSAVFWGFFVDYILSFLVQLIALALQIIPLEGSLNLSRPTDLILMGILLLATGVGGFVAGHRAGESRIINGFMVGVVGILYGALLSLFDDASVERYIIFTQIIGCGMGALGGYLSTFYKSGLWPRS